MTKSIESKSLRDDFTGWYDDLKKDINRNKYKQKDKNNALNDVPVYGGWGQEKLTKEEVMDKVGSLPYPYGEKFVRYIKGGKEGIKKMQKELNGWLSKLNEVELKDLKDFIGKQKIWLGGNRVSEDGRLGRQTLVVLEYLSTHRGLSGIRDALEETKEQFKETIKDGNRDKYKQKDKDNVLDDVQIHGGWGQEKLTKDDVMELVGSLPDPYGEKFVKYIKEGKDGIEKMQDKINAWVDLLQEEGKNKLKEFVKKEGLKLDNNCHIYKDGKLGRQTLAVLKYMANDKNWIDRIFDKWMW